MNSLKRLHSILSDTTIQLRKGEVETIKETDKIVVKEYNFMPHEQEAALGVMKVDLIFLVIGVNPQKAENIRGELINVLNDFPPGLLSKGPSYIEVGAYIGDQGAAFQLFALGKFLGFWDIVTPDRLGMKGPNIEHAAGLGYIMITGYTPKSKPDEQPAI